MSIEWEFLNSGEASSEAKNTNHDRSSTEKR